jgi:hypothetical protein
VCSARTIELQSTAPSYPKAPQGVTLGVRSDSKHRHIVLEESYIDLILGMSWLRKAKEVIHYAKGTVELTSSKGERFEVEITITASTRPTIYLVDGKFVARNIRVVRDFPDIFPKELPGMPLDTEVEFVIDLLPGTAPISKRPYRMSVEE